MAASLPGHRVSVHTQRIKSEQLNVDQDSIKICFHYRSCQKKKPSIFLSVERFFPLFEKLLQSPNPVNSKGEDLKNNQYLTKI